jgi:hypothetical protein
MFGFDQAQNTPPDQHPRMEWNEIQCKIVLDISTENVKNMIGIPTLGEKPCMQIINLNHQKQDDNQYMIIHDPCSTIFY